MSGSLDDGGNLRVLLYGKRVSEVQKVLMLLLQLPRSGKSVALWQRLKKQTMLTWSRLIEQDKVLLVGWQAQMLEMLLLRRLGRQARWSGGGKPF